MKAQQRTHARATQRAAARILGTVLYLAYGLFSLAVHAATPNPIPFVDILSPVSTASGGADFTLTVHGTGFVNGTSEIYWNGAALTNTTTCSSSEKCSVTVPSADIATQGTASVTVVDSSQKGAVSNVLFFPIISSTSAVSFSRKDFEVGDGPSSVAMADFNGDGFLDLAVVNRSDNTVSILLGNGDGTFDPQVTYPTSITPVSVAVGDFNNDGNLDLVVADACGTDLTCSSGGTVSILLGNGNGTFQAQKTFATGVGPSFVAVGDFNGDGNLDLAVANAGCVQFPSGCGSGQNPGNTVSILLGDGTGKFTLKSSPGTDSNPNWIAVGDLNNDGKLDLVVANLGTSSSRGTTVSTLIGKGDGTFTSSSISSQGLSPAAVAVGDFNGDGNLDLAVANACGTDTTCSSSGKVAILLGNGNSSPTFTLQSNTAAGSGPTALVVGDVNANGKLDVVVADGTGSTVSILLGDGAGNLSLQASPASPSTGSAPSSMAIGDLNGDGGLDLVTANKNASGVSILLQAPTATLACGSSEPSGTTCTVAAPPSPPSPSLSFGSGPAGSTFGPMTVSLSNSSNLPLSVSSLAVTSGASSFVIATSSTCDAAPFTLAPGTSCNIDVSFTPTSQGGLGGVIQIGDNAQGSPQLITMSGTGTAALASVAPASLTFTDVSVGSTSAAQSVTLTNAGTVALSGIKISFTGPNASEFAETDTCGTSINASSSCAILVTFTPTAAGVGTPQTATLTIKDLSGSQTLTETVSVTGTGIAPIASASPGMWSFPNQLLGTTSVAQTVNLSNSGAGALTISSISISGTNASEFAQTNDCGSSVPGYGNCTISVVFSPPITPAPGSGTQTATLTVTDNSTGVAGSTQTVSLSGTWIAPVASPSPTSLAFSQTLGSSSAPQTVTLSNTGTAPLTINSIGISGANASEFADTFTCLASLAANSSCTISVTFTPSTTGPAAATLTITDNTNEVAGSTQTVALTGTSTKANTLTTIISNTPNPSIVGLPVMVSFTVAAVAPGVGTPTGTVTVTDGQTGVGDTCTGTLNQGAGSCTLTPSLFPPGGPGVKTLTATYSGDGNFNIGNSAPVSQTVIKANSSITITSNTPNPSTVGLPITVSFAVVPSPPAVGVPTGTVTVIDGTGDHCTASLLSGTGTCTMTPLTPSTPGPKALVATYSGDTNFNTSTSPSAAQTVVKANTLTTITSISPTSVVVGQPFTVSFKVTPPAGDILTPSGTVTVTDGVGDSCAASLSNSSPDIGTGSCSFGPSSTGPLTITASYVGDSNFNASFGTNSTSGLPGLTVVDFSISASPTTQVISSGHTATYTLTLNSLGGFGGTVNLSCSDPQPQTTCTVSPGSITVGGTIQTTVSVVASKSAAHGTFTLTFTGIYGSGTPASGGLTHSSNAFLTIK